MPKIQSGLIISFFFPPCCCCFVLFFFKHCSALHTVKEKLLILVNQLNVYVNSMETMAITTGVSFLIPRAIMRKMSPELINEFPKRFIKENSGTQ